MSAVLLDTHALLWLDNGTSIEPRALDAIARAQREGGMLVSAVTSWEVGVLVARGRIVLDAAAPDWLDRFLAQPGVRPVPLSVAAALAASSLPEPLHADPADRLLIATARELRAPLVTRDRRILAYAKAGHVAAVAC